MSELNKKIMQTPDLNEERLNTLKKIFPDLFTVEGKLNPDELQKIIDPDLVKDTERFEFKWFGKSEAKRNAFTPSKATLVYDEERSVNPEHANGNMLIEGENLETLKCLLSAYREQVKCIYIDPPYNTGKDFVYSDKWDESKEDYWEHIGVTENGVKVDTNYETSGRYHSNWMNMIFCRLLIARQFLNDNGVIFISIGDEELQHLTEICNIVFGEENRLAVVCREMKKGANRGTHFAPAIDYIIAYAKDISALDKFYEPVSEEYINSFTLDDKDGRGKYKTTNLYEPSLDYYENCRYEVTCPDNTVIITPKNKSFSHNKESYEGLLKDNRIVFSEGRSSLLVNIDGSPTKWTLKRKLYLNEMLEKGRRPSDLFLDFINANGTKEMNAIGIKFSFAKPTQLIKYLFAITNSKDGYFMDFFAGSGTAAQAIIELNKENGNTRKFILIQLPEKIEENEQLYKDGFRKISDITIERNKRVIKKLEKEEAEKQPSLLDSDKKPFKTGFKVYKLTKSNFPRVDFAPDPEKTEEENLALLDKYIEEKEAMFLAMIDEKTIFDEVLLKNGFMLNYSKEKEEGFSKNAVYRIKDDFKECLICTDMTIQKETLKKLEEFKDKIFICLERGLDTTMKWNLKHLLGDKLIAF
jgi:adenine-specific DNA-methyltransferase